MATTASEIGDERSSGTSKWLHCSQASCEPEQSSWGRKEAVSDVATELVAGTKEYEHKGTEESWQERSWWVQGLNPTPSTINSEIPALFRPLEAEISWLWAWNFLTLQAVPVGAGAGGRRGGLGSDNWCKCTLLFHGRDHVGWWEGEDARRAAAVGGEACRGGHGGAGWYDWEQQWERRITSRDEGACIDLTRPQWSDHL